MLFVIREVDCQAVTFKRLCGLPFSVLNLQVRFVFVYLELIVWNTEWERSHNLYTCPEKKNESASALYRPGQWIRELWLRAEAT